LTEICASVDFSELPEYVKTKSEFNEYLTRHKNAGSRVVKKQERDEVIQFFIDNRTEITPEAITHLRQNKAEALAAVYPEGEIKLFTAKNWTLEYEIAKSGLYKELDIAVKMAKGEQAGLKTTFEDAKKESDETYKDGTNDIVAYQIFKPINDGVVSKAIVAQYLAEILESHPKKYKTILEFDEHLEYLVEAIKHVTPKRI
jgi:putative ATP-dependent endonuclease of OLD family